MTCTLQEIIPNVELEVLKKQLKMKTGNIIDPSIRSFTLTLNFYSPMAYKYVRQVFNKSLPHPSTLKKWYATVDGAPGFTAETLNAVKMKVNELNGKGKKLVCGVIIDEMYIKEATHFNGQRLQGYVNYGLGADNHEVCLKLQKPQCSWQWHSIPIGKFLLLIF